jgi:hypothetical protein
MAAVDSDRRLEAQWPGLKGRLRAIIQAAEAWDAADVLIRGA